MSLARRDHPSHFLVDGFVNFFDRQNRAFDLPDPILRDLNFFADHFERVGKRLAFTELWRVNLQLPPRLQAGFENARHDRRWVDVARNRRDRLDRSKASAGIRDALFIHREPHHVFLDPVAHASFERVAPGFRLCQLDVMGVARLKLCFRARAVCYGLLFQAVEERPGALW
jgi:hypothetical protein